MPLDATVSSKAARRVTSVVRSHVFEAALPRGGVVYVGGGLCVSSPELCFFWMASELSLVKLIELGFELCGSYSLPGPAPGEEGAYRRPPLTSTKKLAAFVGQMAGAHGVRKATRALRYIADGSASPMETVLVMLLTLPYKLGGYGLYMPELNARVTPAKTAKKIASKSHYYCDLFWPDVDVAAEYDSDQFHTGPDRISSDSKRRNALATMGVLVVTVTNRQIRDTVELEKVAKQLAAGIGKQLRHNEKPGFRNAQRELRGMLL
ncbi:MAG: hypothetical protein FWF91_02295 [Coriobacteriia bacterium]|nr:hypothetical protein [Coriobacteriia bacterium]